MDDGSTDGTRDLIQSWIDEKRLDIRYIYKENGGLYTGYNTAYQAIETKLNVCIDSDDSMPPEAVEKILALWEEKGSDCYAGIIGLDCEMTSGEPIGGRFPSGMKECYFPDLYARNIHRGDTKQVMRTDLMKEVAPQIGFLGEKNFNPVYMLLQVTDRYPLLVLDECLCLVEYQAGDSMSGNIFRQYIDSPRSFAKMRRLEMTLRHSTPLNRFRSATHYVTECLLAKDPRWFSDSPRKALTLLGLVPGWLFSLYIRRKAGRND